MIELTEQQLKAMDADPSLLLVDPHTQKTYVLVDAARYELWRRLFEQQDNFDMKQVAVLVNHAMREDDVDDPTIAYYQQKYGRKP